MYCKEGSIVADALKEAITDYLTSKKISAIELSKLPGHNLPRRELSDFLRERNLIGVDDQVYIAGTDGNPYYPGRFQIGIGQFNGVVNIDRPKNAYLILNFTGLRVVYLKKGNYLQNGIGR